IWKYSKEHGRHDLPWRKTTDPYHILVSEIMLQQTQVDRVVPYFTTWMKRYPTPKKLSVAPLSDVLTLWQGLGYNRRAKGLWEASKVITDTYKGVLPTDPLELEKLPGVGPYTARAVAAFAYNQDVIFIETNIRTVIAHHFYPGKTHVSDDEIRGTLTEVFPKGRSREWYGALMDYGSFLKRSGIKLNATKKGYKKQSAFEGSDRQARGAILRSLIDTPRTRTALSRVLGTERKEQALIQLDKLLAERLVEKKGTQYALPN
ncbi:A/G-specific adenine glycosylase, partial [Patescibacteria group bacterium]|nr:A/G-specific adenine glycosylase [Patescibacteria group bacterium]MBU1755055.1 A/G-specific adenine glycosylase [Patescibacteria group bacterium]